MNVALGKYSAVTIVIFSILVGCRKAPEAAKPANSDPLPESTASGVVASRELALVDVIDVSELDGIPVRIFQVRPVYPLDLHKRGVAGEAMVDFVIDVHGDVRNAFAVSATHRDFGAAAVDSVTQWKFHPGRKGGRDVNTRMRVPIVFTSVAP